ncbi:MAG: PEGA domain-containing protein [Betaproteobacteria bacterium]
MSLNRSESADPEHQEAVLAAARAAVAWAHARQASWDELEADAPVGDDLDSPADVAEPVEAPPVAREAADVARPAAPPPVLAPPPVVESPRELAPPPVLQPFALAPSSASEPESRFVPSPMFGSTLFAETAAGEPDKPSGPSALARLAAGARTAAPALGKGLMAAGVLAGLAFGGMKGREYWQRREAALRNGVAVIESLPAGSQVAVDGQPAGLTPLTTTLTAGTHTVEFRFRGAVRSVQVTVPGGGRVSELFDWTRKPTGGLSVTTTPAGARVLVDGEPRGVAPITIPDLVVGTHTVLLESSEGAVRRTVTITEGKTADVTESIVAGWMKVFSPFEVTIAEGNRALRLDDSGQVMLPAGQHDIRFENRQLGYREVRHVAIQPGQPTTLSLVPPQSKLTVQASVPSEVWIDGTAVGQTPLVDQPVDLGTREVVVKDTAGDQRTFTITVTTKPTTLNVDFSSPSGQ